MSAVDPLNIAILLGSERAGRQGEHVLNVVKAAVKRRATQHHVTIIDALEADLPVLRTPHHHYGAYVPGVSPAPLPAIAAKLEAADVLIVIDGEYNHSPTPGMLNLLDHFHHGQYKHKVAGIVTYSAQLTGGARSAYVLRNTLGELAMVTIPSIYMVPSVFTAIDTAAHTLKDDAATLRLENWFNELEWYGHAVKAQRSTRGLPVIQEKLATPVATPAAAKVAAASNIKKN